MAKKGNFLGMCAVSTALVASIIFVPPVIARQNLEYTSADISSNTTYISTLKSIENDYDIIFNNYDLYTAVLKQIDGNFTVEKLRSIKTLDLDMNLFENKDLSDLKYFINLEKITISNGSINCEDLAYNQYLTNVTLDYCDVCNMQELPNSIHRLSLNNTRVTDGLVTVPYDTYSLTLNNSISNRIRVKNPQKLKTFTFCGYSFLDLEDIKACSNLQYLTIKQSPNVSHAEVLKYFENLEKLDLDEFCCIWGNKDTIPNLSKEHRKIMTCLDQIIDGLITPDMTEEEKIEHITLFVLSRIDYDFNINGESQAAKDLLSEYNQEPLTCALSDGSGVCVGYAALFEALANRAGIDVYQPDSVNHTWNMVRLSDESEYRAYDLTPMDNPNAVIGTFDNRETVQGKTSQDYINENRAQELLYYNFDLQEAQKTGDVYNTNVEKIDISYTDNNIGYINSNSSSSEEEIDLIRAKLAATEGAIVIIISYIASKKKQKKEKTKRKQKVNRPQGRREYC